MRMFDSIQSQIQDVNVTLYSQYDSKTFGRQYCIIVPVATICFIITSFAENIHISMSFLLIGSLSFVKGIYDCNRKVLKNALQTFEVYYKVFNYTWVQHRFL